MARVLVVEDEAHIRELIQLHLGLEGLDIEAVGDGQEALARANTEPFDLIILDLHMPRLDGFEAIRAIRADANLAHIPVMALTASAMMGDREIALSSGFTAYLAKPIPLASLRQEVSRLVQGSHVR